MTDENKRFIFSKVITALIVLAKEIVDIIIDNV